MIRLKGRSMLERGQHELGHKSTDAGAKTEAFPAVTSLRFIAALHVVFFHYLNPVVKDVAPLARIVAHGYVSVSFFYALSGFVLAHNYRRQTFVAPSERFEFWRKRFARIYPIYFVAFLAYAPFMLAFRFADQAGLMPTLKVVLSGVTNLLALQAWLPWISSSWNQPSWSISVEAFFYFAFPWLGPLLLRFKRPVLGLGLAWGAALMVPALAALLHVSIDSHGSGSAVSQFVRFCPLFHVPAFAFGVLLKRVHEGRRVHPGWLVVGALAFGVALNLAPPKPALFLLLGGLLPIYGIVLLAAATPPSWVTRALHLRPLVFLGEASYSLYILQVPLWLIVGKLVGGASRVTTPLIFLAVAIAVSCVAHVVIEIPARRFINRLGVRRLAAANAGEARGLGEAG